MYKKTRVTLCVLFIVIRLFSQSDDNFRNEKLMQATRMAQEILILDSHLDVPFRLSNNFEDISVRTNHGHFDYPRAVMGGLNVAFFAVFVPSDLQKKGGAKAKAEEQIDLIYGLQNKWPEKFRVIHSTSEVKKYYPSNMILLGIGLENGAAIEDQIANLKHFYQRGIRYITLTHSKNNRICDSSFDDEKLWNGLSPFGVEVIREMNKLGIMVDVSHVSDQAFWQIVDISQAPIIASHSACRFFTPNFERNLDDEMIKAIAHKGGVIQIAFGSFFLTQEFSQRAEMIRKKVTQYVVDNNLTEQDSLTRIYIEKVKNEYPAQPGTIVDLVNHIDHVVKLVGINYVGLGSDFEGVGVLPVGIKDVSSYPEIILELLNRGYSEHEIQQICGDNFLRVWAKVEERSRQLSEY